MNIQIFGTKKCNDTKKAQRYFQERGVNFQFIDMKEKGLSKGEFMSVANAVGGLSKMLNCNCKDKTSLSLIKHTVDEDRQEKAIQNQNVLITPIVRNGKLSTLGYQPEIWKEWN